MLHVCYIESLQFGAHLINAV